MKIFAHRGMFGCTDINNEHLTKIDVKGTELKNFLPENSEGSIVEAFKNGFGVEVDVVLTKDKELLITHTNKLSLHSMDAKETDYASELNLADILKMRTGKGGQTAPFLTYNRLKEILLEYPKAIINVEIKGNMGSDGNYPEPTNPNIVEKLVEETTEELMSRIIWSSFAVSNLVKMKKLKPNSNVAMLFIPSISKETKLYHNSDETYLAFNTANLEFVLSKIPNLNAVHPCIDTLNDIVLSICNNKRINVRSWSLLEKNPLKNMTAKNAILDVVNFQKKYQNSSYDIMTDFPREVRSMGI